MKKFFFMALMASTLSSVVFAEEQGQATEFQQPQNEQTQQQQTSTQLDRFIEKADAFSHLSRDHYE